jgi:maltooligosyltrehalose trehalohydrolase
MPFGAEVLDDGTVRFRLWSPKAQDVLVDLSSNSLPMSRLEDGWFELVTPEARPGTLYQFTIDRQHRVTDPASRYQPSGVHGPSQVVDPAAFIWEHDNWRGRPWEEAVIYELHVGTFSPEGTFGGAERKLNHLTALGITAIELMPLSSFAGRWNWGYDGVLPYAPADSYGRPEELKHFVDTAHSAGLMVFLDVVYNHFGPEGNYLHLYSPEFFSSRHRTPWGDAVNFDGPGSRVVRDYFIHNALFWLEEYQIDGLRLDAVHAIYDDSYPEFLIELAETVRRALPRERLIHLVLENNRNAAHYLKSDPQNHAGGYTAQWNDDIHHALHVLLTGESDGYYADYCGNPIWHLGRCLSQGYSYQGEDSQYRGGKSRGEPSQNLPPGCFVSFLQNHDQIGNRAFGDRIGTQSDPRKVKAALAVFLLSPSLHSFSWEKSLAQAMRFSFSATLGLSWLLRSEKDVVPNLSDLPSSTPLMSTSAYPIRLAKKHSCVRSSIGLRCNLLHTSVGYASIGDCWSVGDGRFCLSFRTFCLVRRNSRLWAQGQFPSIGRLRAGESCL